MNLSAPEWLYHYTCEHGHHLIQKERPTLLRVHPKLKWLWLTDLAQPDREALGLTSHTITCDRTRYRYAVLPTGDIHRWVDVRREFSPQVRDALENTHHAAPMHWWLSFTNLQAQFDPEPT